MTKAPDKAGLRIVDVTRGLYESGNAFDGWAGDPEFGRIGGSFGAMQLASPVGQQGTDTLLLISAQLGNQPIGHMHFISGLLHAGDREIPVLWGSGLVVLPEHRSTGAGLMILLRLRAKAIASGAVGVSKLALPIYSQLGWLHLEAERHLLIRRSAPILQRWIRKPVLLRLASWLVDLPLALQRLILTAAIRLRLRRFRVEVTARMPEELDAQISRLEKPLKCHRSARWLNWALNSGPQQNNRRLHLIRNDDGRVLGYFMTSLMHHDEADGGNIRNIRLASAKDWMSFDEKELDDAGVLMLALKTLLNMQADAIEICVPERDTGQTLRRLGMLRKGALHAAIRLPPDLKALQEELSNSGQFWFRPADGDGFLN